MRERWEKSYGSIASHKPKKKEFQEKSTHQWLSGARVTWILEEASFEMEQEKPDFSGCEANKWKQ